MREPATACRPAPCCRPAAAAVLAALALSLAPLGAQAQTPQAQTPQVQAQQGQTPQPAPDAPASRRITVPPRDALPPQPRFAFAPVEGGALKLDTVTGQVSLCTKGSAGFACVAVPDTRDAYEAEIARLQAENDRLKGKAAPDSAAPPRRLRPRRGARLCRAPLWPPEAAHRRIAHTGPERAAVIDQLHPQKVERNASTFFRA